MIIAKRNAVSGAVTAVVIVGIILGAFLFLFTFFYPQITQSFCTGICGGGFTTNPITKTYTAYVAVFGHRDQTPFHSGFHAYAHLDNIQVYSANAPSPSSSAGWWFAEQVYLTFTLTSSGGSAPVTNQVTLLVGPGTQFVQPITYTSLTSGTYTCVVNLRDSNGNTDQLSTTFVLP